MEDIDDDLCDAKNLLKEFGIEKEKNSQSVEQNVEEYGLQIKLEKHIYESQNEDLLKELEGKENQDKHCEYNGDEDINNIAGKKEYVPFGSFVIENANNNNCLKKEKTFVDLSLNELYNSAENTKRCLNCGTENNKDANSCIICGEKFNKGEFYENN